MPRIGLRVSIPCFEFLFASIRELWATHSNGALRRLEQISAIGADRKAGAAERRCVNRTEPQRGERLRFTHAGRLWKPVSEQALRDFSSPILLVPSKEWALPDAAPQQKVVRGVAPRYTYAKEVALPKLR